MGKRKLRKQIKELEDRATHNLIMSEKHWRAANLELVKAHNVAIERIDALENKLRFALVNVRAPEGKTYKWEDGVEPCLAMPIYAQEKLGCVPIDTTYVSLADIPNPEPEQYNGYDRT